MIVHVLRQGITLCGFEYGKYIVPGEWPPGHRWTWDFMADEEATCEGCKAKLAEEAGGAVKGNKKKKALL